VLRELRQLPNGQRLIGQSPSFSAAISTIPAVAKSDASVLIFGETGTGKELCAQAIHYSSLRAQNPFVPVNCGSIPTSLVENELFGHRPGAFTSASTSRSGLIQEADHGTLFLDEVTSLPMSAQVKVLRFLQEKEYRPLGSSKTRLADVRVIAASNIDIEKAVMEGRMRRDLYYRLNVIPIKLPPLRERREDIPILARHFLKKYSAKYGKKVNNILPEAMQVLMLFDWPGNVRELEHVVQRAVVLTDHSAIGPKGVVLPRLQDKCLQECFKEAKARMIAKFEKDYVTKYLAAFDGNVTRAAQAAQKNRRAFWELIRKHRIDVKCFRQIRATQKSDNPPHPSG
jgi:two-component system response regulator GlrR